VQAPYLRFGFRVLRVNNDRKAVPSSHILVADDERSIRLMLEAGLKLNGFRVTAVPTAREALEVAANWRIDAVLSDIYMPDGGGLDLVKDIHQMDPAISDYSDDPRRAPVEAAVRAISEGATDFIGKPFDVARCGRTFARHLGARRERRRHQPRRAIESAFRGQAWLAEARRW